MSTEYRTNMRSASHVSYPEESKRDEIFERSIIKKAIKSHITTIVMDKMRAWGKEEREIKNKKIKDSFDFGWTGLERGRVIKNSILEFNKLNGGEWPIPTSETPEICKRIINRECAKIIKERSKREEAKKLKKLNFTTTIDDIPYMPEFSWVRQRIYKEIGDLQPQDRMDVFQQTWLKVFEKLRNRESPWRGSRGVRSLGKYLSKALEDALNDEKKWIATQKLHRVFDISQPEPTAHPTMFGPGPPVKEERKEDPARSPLTKMGGGDRDAGFGYHWGKVTNVNKVGGFISEVRGETWPDNLTARYFGCRDRKSILQRGAHEPVIEYERLYDWQSKELGKWPEEIYARKELYEKVFMHPSLDKYRVFLIADWVSGTGTPEQARLLVRFYRWPDYMPRLKNYMEKQYKNMIRKRVETGKKKFGDLARELLPEIHYIHDLSKK